MADVLVLRFRSIATAVRIGDITKFNEALSSHSDVFTRDSNMSLIVRLRHNVIKTALRTISLAYSRISLSDVSAKLHLDSEEDAEYIVAKAIRDGVIQATVDHEKGFMASKETGDVYATNEPQMAFDTRIKFLLELHNQSVKVRSILPFHLRDTDACFTPASLCSSSFDSPFPLFSFPSTRLRLHDSTSNRIDPNPRRRRCVTLSTPTRKNSPRPAKRASANANWRKKLKTLLTTVTTWMDLGTWTAFESF